jgi:hypothetical protein
VTANSSPFDTINYRPNSVIYLLLTIAAAVLVEWLFPDDR